MPGRHGRPIGPSDADAAPDDPAADAPPPTHTPTAPSPSVPAPATPDTTAGATEGRRDLVGLYASRVAATGVNLVPIQEGWGVGRPGALAGRQVIIAEPVRFGRGTPGHPIAPAGPPAACRRPPAGLPGRPATLRPRPRRRGASARTSAIAALPAPPRGPRRRLGLAPRRQPSDAVEPADRPVETPQPALG